MTPTTTFSRPAKRWPTTTVLLLTLLLLLSTTGCLMSSPNIVVVEGEEMITVRKATLDRLYSDNERLIQALTECQTP